MPQSSCRKVVTALIVTEEKSAVFYERFAHLFRDRQDIASFWRTMAADERQHKDFLLRLLDELCPDTLREAVEEDLSDKVKAMEDFMEQEADTVPSNLEEAYQISDECEQREVIPLILLLAESVIPAKVRDPILEHQIEVHNRRLSAFDKKTGGPAKRRAIPSRP